MTKRLHLQLLHDNYPTCCFTRMYRYCLCIAAKSESALGDHANYLDVSSIGYARYANVFSYIADANHASRIFPGSGPTPSVEISFDGWMFPKGGVAFVWMLESELTAPRPSVKNPSQTSAK